MPGNKAIRSKMVKYCKESMMDINRTMAEIDKGIFLQMTESLRLLVAEFAATFAVRQWAVEHGWSFQGGLFRKTSVSCEDMKLFSEAQRLGALFRNISLHHSGSYFQQWYNFQIEAAPLGFETLNNFGVDGRIISEALKSGLHVKTCNFLNCSNEDIRVFFEEITTPVKLEKLGLCRDRRNIHFGTPPDSGVIRHIFSKFKSGAALQCVESLSLRSMSMTNYHAELIGELLRGGVKLKSLDLAHNNFDGEGALQLIKSIEEGSELKELDLTWNKEIGAEGHALIKARKLTGCEIYLTVNGAFITV